MRLMVALALWSALASIPTAAGAQSGFLAGAAKVETTPPLFDAAADAAMFPLCPPAVFSGPRLFGLQEPYVDLDGSGFFNYSLDPNDPMFGQGADSFCDANGNGRYDGLYSAGGVDHLLAWVHDAVHARALAVGDGQRTAVIVSIPAIGLFENVTKRMRARARELIGAGVDVELFFSADHNESTPDTIGLFGAPSLGGVTGGFSGIDDYYLDFLVERTAEAAAAAVAAMVPARLSMTEAMPPADLPTHLSRNFPTTNDDGSPAAIDPKLRVLQAVAAADGAPIATVLSLSAHNQQVGHAGDGETVVVAGVPERVNRAVSGDWPSAFHAYLEGRGVGLPIFLVGANGSIEDPAQQPELPGTFEQALQTGIGLGDAVLAALPQLRDLAVGTVTATRREFTVPLENNLFVAAGAAGIFGDRQLYTDGVPTGRVGDSLLTEVGVIEVGPDLQFLAHPSESFPALAVGSPWGIEEAGCPERPNPPVPSWHGHARFRASIGLANDLIGYLIPAWGWSTGPAFTNSTCFNDQDDVDPAGHQHKLETESVGWTAGNLVAEQLTDLLAERPDPVAEVRFGRFVMADGGLTRRAPGAVGVLLTGGSCTVLAPATTTLIALSGVTSIAGRTPDAVGRFMDYDGVAQAAPDLLTRGMSVGGTGEAPAARYYVDVYPALSESGVCPTATPTATAGPVTPTPSATPTSAPATCGPGPRSGCRAPVVSGKARLQLRNGGSENKDRWQWKWLGGAATTQADFADPTAGTGYALCIYDGSASLIASAAIPAGGSCNAKSPRPCWRASGRGFRYVDKDRTPNGIQQVVLKAGSAGKAQIIVQGKGALLPHPALPIADLPVTVQLVSGAGQCWAATYGSSLRNDGEQFKARAD